MEPQETLGIVLYGLVAIATAVGSLVNLLDSTVWLTAIDPRVGLAAKILDKFFQHS